MKLLTSAAAILAACISIAAQEREREVPKDSERIAIPGCAYGRTFIVGEPAEHEPIRSAVAPGRRFRLSGKRELLADIRARESHMLEITGLVRKSQVGGPGGIAIAGGRVRIGGGLPQASTSDPRRDPLYNEVVIDVESWRLLATPCPER